MNTSMTFFALCVQHALWPIVTIIAMYCFKTEIAQALARVSKVGPVDFDPSQTQSGNPFESENTRIAVEEAMKTIPDSPVLREIESNIQKNLEQRRLTNNVAAIPLLVKALSAVLLAYEFESIYRMIFGSQLQILNHLNACLLGDTIDNVRRFYNQAAATYPGVYANKPFEEYISFLKNRLLIHEESGKYSITQKGKEFLVSIVKAGYTNAKLL